VRDLFFKRQIEECRELARHAVDEVDRVFWQEATKRWEAQLQELQKTTHPKTRTITHRLAASQEERLPQVTSWDGLSRLMPR
jgi:hypothetical protein